MTESHDKDGLPIVPFDSQVAWRKWLTKEHQRSRGLWIMIAKKASGVESVTYAEALDVALCFGWIDGQKGSYDETHFLQRFTPRGPRSKWSQINVNRVAELIAEGKMKPAGQATIDAAKADGRWDAAYPSSSTATVPEDFQKALNKNKKAAAYFETLTKAQRYSFLYQIHDAKRPTTREARITKFVAMLADQRHLGGPI